jgi:hypothetical protein
MFNKKHVANVFWARCFITVQQVIPDYAGTSKKYA